MKITDNSLSVYWAKVPSLENIHYRPLKRTVMNTCNTAGFSPNLYAKKKWLVNFLLLIIGTVTISSFYSCKDKKTSSQKIDTPISGAITVSADETFGHIIEEEKMVFETEYDSATINLQKKPAKDAIDDFMNNKVRLIIIPRKLNEEEMSYFRQSGFVPQHTFIAYDALAFIINNNNQDTSLSVTTLKNILSGKIKTWKQLSASSKLGDIQIVFDNKKSSTVSYIQQEILKGQSLSTNSYATNDNKSVMDYVSMNENTLGVIGVNWISNKQDTSVQSFLKMFKVVAVTSVADSSIFVRPYQRQLSIHNYPFMRKVYIISRETHMGLGTGFASFIAGDRGQVIISRAGLYPSRKSLRMIEVKKSFDEE